MSFTATLWNFLYSPYDAVALVITIVALACHALAGGKDPS